jgi:GalNAc5-diNAcBac-PP-undecaprenol beta-1,3-glucosyltransferase
MVNSDHLPAVRVLVIIPTHDHASTLDLAISSALEQTFTDLEIVVIGDGVGEDTRQIVNSAVKRDSRVSFVECPKSPSRAEPLRHRVMMESDAAIVTYLGDDDLFLPDHVSRTVQALKDHDFCHPYPAFIGPDGHVFCQPVDIANPDCRAWHLRHRRNRISQTGAAHTMKLYRRLPFGWRAPPAGVWSDHYFFQEILRIVDLRAKTLTQATTIKTPASLTKEWSAAERRAALQAWWTRIHAADFAEHWQREVCLATQRAATEFFSVAIAAEQRDAAQTELRLARSGRKAAIPKDFDADAYVALYPDLMAAGVDGRRHFLEYGFHEGRSFPRKTGPDG